MRLSRTDLLPVLTIVAGGVIGASVSAGILMPNLLLMSRSGDVRALDPVVAPRATAESATPKRRRAIASLAIADMDIATIIAQAPDTPMQQMLRARTPDLDFTRLSGVAGSGSSINIRGFSSIAIGNQPRIYVDGVLVDNSYSNPIDSPLDEVEPEDIESIEVLKGDAAVALYGEEASAGAILITLKKDRTRR